VICDRLDHRAGYSGLFPHAGTAFDLLRSGQAQTLAEGRHEFPDHPIIVNVMSRDGQAEHSARLEAHRKYIDIQYLIEGEEWIGWKAIEDCAEPDGHFDEDADVIFFRDRPSTLLALRPGMFAVFFPQDAHAPLIGSGNIRKVVLKVPVPSGDRA